MRLKHLLSPLGILSFVPLLAPAAASQTPIPAHLEARTFVKSTHPVPAHPPTMLFGFTEKCDSASELAEDCRVTLAGTCDASRGHWPTCQDGRCQCLAKACLTSKTCPVFRQCRQDDQEAFCSTRADALSGSAFLGVCGCRPRVTGCMGGQAGNGAAAKGTGAAAAPAPPADSGVAWCAARMRCSERFFSLYREHVQCVATPGSGRGGAGGGFCRCGTVDCAVKATPEDFETCKGLVDCGAARPFCNMKTLGPHSKGEGYCTCV